MTLIQRPFHSWRGVGDDSGVPAAIPLVCSSVSRVVMGREACNGPQLLAGKMTLGTRSHGYAYEIAGRAVPVNPNSAEVEGTHCSDLHSIPGTLDVVATDPIVPLELVREC